MTQILSQWQPCSLQKNPDVYTIWNYRRQALAGALEVGLHHAQNVQVDKNNSILSFQECPFAGG